MIKITNYRQLHDVDNKEQGIVIVGTCLSTDEKPMEYAGGSILIETDHDGGFWVWMFDEGSMSWILQTTWFDSSSIKCDCPTVDQITSQVLAKLPVSSRTRLGIVQIGDECLSIYNGVLGIDLEKLKSKLNYEISDDVIEQIKKELQEWVKEYIEDVIGDNIQQIVEQYLTEHMGDILNYIVANMPIASKTQKGIVQIGDNITVNEGTISVPIATGDSVGVVKGSDSVLIDADGTATVPLATDSKAGIVIVGDNINLDAATGTISIGYASKTNYGVVKIGNNITVTDGVISSTASGGGGSGYELPLMTTEIRGGAKLRDGTTLGDVELDTAEGMYVDVTELDDRIKALEEANAD